MQIVTASSGGRRPGAGGRCLSACLRRSGRAVNASRWRELRHYRRPIGPRSAVLASLRARRVPPSEMCVCDRRSDLERAPHARTLRWRPAPITARRLWSPRRMSPQLRQFSVMDGDGSLWSVIWDSDQLWVNSVRVCEISDVGSFGVGRGPSCAKLSVTFN